MALEKRTVILRKEHNGPLAPNLYITLREIFQETLMKPQIRLPSIDALFAQKSFLDTMEKMPLN